MTQHRAYRLRADKSIDGLSENTTERRATGRMTRLAPFRRPGPFGLGRMERGKLAMSAAANRSPAAPAEHIPRARRAPLGKARAAHSCAGSLETFGTIARRRGMYPGRELVAPHARVCSPSPPPTYAAPPTHSEYPHLGCIPPHARADDAPRARINNRARRLSALRGAHPERVSRRQSPSTDRATSSLNVACALSWGQELKRASSRCRQGARSAHPRRAPRG